jgi:hypothetical protein
MQLDQRGELHAMPPTKRNGLPGDPDTLPGMYAGAGGVDTEGPPAQTCPKLDAEVPSGQSATAGGGPAIDDPMATTNPHPATEILRPINRI